MTDVKEKIKRAPRIPDDATIYLGKNSEGVGYGKDNNPKRKGSKTFDRFAGYKDGMTVAQAKAVGITASDIAYDRDHNLITVKRANTETKAAA